jgi:hypothetical protein
MENPPVVDHSYENPWISHGMFDVFRIVIILRSKPFKIFKASKHQGWLPAIKVP